MSSTAPRFISARLLILPSAIFLAVLTYVVFKSAYYEGDSLWLLKSVYKIKGDMEGVNYPLGTQYLHFPLFQHLTGLALAYVTSSSDAVLHGWAILSGIAFLASLPVLFLTLKKIASVPTAVVASLMLLGFPYIWYSNSTFGEGTAAFVTLLFTAGLLLRWPWPVLIFLFWCAGITKEVAFPFLAAFWLMAIFFRPVPAGTTRFKQIIPILPAILLTGASNVGFNYYRFHTWHSQHSYEGTLPLFSRRHMEFFLALWISPNGGLLFFFPAFIAALFYTAFRQLRVGRAALPVVSLLLILLLLTLGFGAWYSPFGWWCWGPRLLMPWMPSLLLLLFGFYGDFWESTLRAINRRWWANWLVALPLALVGLPHVICLGDHQPYIDFFDPTKNPGYPQPIHPEIPYFEYYRYTSFWMWQRHCVLLDTFSLHRKPIPLLLAALEVAAIVSLFAWLWCRAKTSQLGRAPLPYA